MASKSDSAAGGGGVSSLRRKNCLIVILHGSGGNGAEIRSFLEQAPMIQMKHKSFCDVILRANGNSAPFNFFKCEIMTPTSTMKPYTPFGGQSATVWHDRPANFMDLGVSFTEESRGIDESIKKIGDLIAQKAKDIVIDNIIVGGFSMGGGLALHFLRNDVLARIGMAGKLLGVFSMGSYLSNSSAVFAKAGKDLASVPLFMMHGQRDQLIKCDWGKATATNMLLSEVNVRFQSFPGAVHEITPEMLQELAEFLIEVLSSQVSKEQIDMFAHKKLSDLALKITNMSVSDESNGSCAKRDESGSNMEGIEDEVEIVPESIATPKNVVVYRNDRQLPFYFSKIDNPSSSNAVSSSYDSYQITFIAVPDVVPVLCNRSVLYGGSSFEIKADPNNESQVYTIVNTPSPEYSGQEISKRLFIRIQSDSASVNPCPIS